MSERVQIKEAGTGDWLTLDDVTVTDTDGLRQIAIPAASAFAARLSAAGPRRYLVTIGEWHGLIRGWRHNDIRIEIDVRSATTVEDLQG